VRPEPTRTGAPENHYLVVSHNGRFGTAFTESGLRRPTMKPPAQWSAARGDVQHRYRPGRDVSQEILRRLDLEGSIVPSVLEDFIDRHVGRDRQLTLRLALT